MTSRPNPGPILTLLVLFCVPMEFPSTLTLDIFVPGRFAVSGYPLYNTSNECIQNV